MFKSFKQSRFKKRGKELLILLAILCSSYSAKAQRSDLRLLGKLRLAYVKAKTNREKAETTTHLGELFLDSHHDLLDSSIYFFKRSIKLCVTPDLKDQELLAYACLAIAYGKKEDWKNCRASYEYVINWHLKHREIKMAAETYDWLHAYFYMGTNLNVRMIRESIGFCIKERLLYRELRDTMAVIKSIKDQGDVSLYIRSLDTAEKYLNTALFMYKKNHYKKLYDVYYLLAASSHLRGDLHKELDYRQKTISSMLASNDTVNQARFYSALAMTYESLQQYDLSLNYFEKAMIKFPTSVGICWHVVQALINSGQKTKAVLFFEAHVRNLKIEGEEAEELYNNLLGCYYQALGRMKKAETSYLRNVRYGENDFSTVGGSSESKIRDYKIIATFYVKRGAFDKAAEYIHRIDSIPTFNISFLTLGDIELLKFKVDSARKHFVPAIRHYQAYKSMMDSIINFSKARQISELEVRHAMEEKDKDIVILKKESLLDQQSYIKKVALTKYWIYSTLILAILITALYRSNVLKRKSFRLLRKKQQEIVEKNTELENLNKDNEWLLREVHHRVKNNLHMIMSLLQSQSRYIKDERALKAVLDSQHRVHAMSLIHQKLYKARHATAIYMPEYVNELVEYLKQSFRMGTRIIFALQIEPLFFDVGIAVPVGLILNEAITNALKYAFPNRRIGTITVELTCPENTIAYLKITDDGLGLPKDFDFETRESFGMRLLQGLIIGDLSGNFDLVSDKGTSLIMSFEINPIH